MVKELPVMNSFGNAANTSVSMHCDCQAAISIAKKKAFNGKHIRICLRHDVVKQLLKDEIISIDYGFVWGCDEKKCHLVSYV